MISPLEIFHLSPALLYTCPRMAADPDAPPKPSLSPPPPCVSSASSVCPALLRMAADPDALPETSYSDKALEQVRAG